jgi:hypothetical protein
MKNILFGFILIIFSNLLKAQANENFVLNIHFITESCNDKILISFREFKNTNEKIALFDRKTQGIIVVFESNNAYVLNFLCGDIKKNFLIDTNYIDDNMEILFPIDFKKKNTIQCLYYNVEKDIFIVN